MSPYQEAILFINNYVIHLNLDLAGFASKFCPICGIHNLLFVCLCILHANEYTYVENRMF